MKLSSRAKPGSALRAFRLKKRWTLADVTKRTGLQTSTLSRIENDQVSPTYDQLSKLSDGLGVDLAELLSSMTAPSSRTGRRSVNRLSEGQVLETPTEELRYLSTDLANKQFTPIIAEIRAQTLEEAGEFHRHDGEEFVFVIEGELALHSESYTPLRLTAGESVYFDSSMPHAYVAMGERTCRVLSICTAPHEQAPGMRPRI